MSHSNPTTNPTGGAGDRRDLAQSALHDAPKATGPWAQVLLGDAGVTTSDICTPIIRKDGQNENSTHKQLL